MNPHDLARIGSSLRAAASRNRETARFGPFLATLSPTSDNPFLNYAIPDADADPTPDEAAALAAFYETRNRKPRLEYVPELAPRVEPLLLTARFHLVTRAPLLTLGVPLSAPFPPGVVFAEPRSEEEVHALVSVLNEAYGGDPPTESEVERQKRRIEDGTIALLTLLDGEPAGGGLVVPPEDGLAEVTSIGVRGPFRRRGLAASIVSRLTELALERRVDLPFLMAASEAEARIYARVGYERMGEMLFISKN